MGTSKLRLASSLPWLCSKASTKRGVLGMSFVRGTACMSLGIGSNNVYRLLCFFIGNSVAWGWSLASGVALT